MSETTIIEINGVKLEVDLRNAKRVDNFRVGDAVKVLRKRYSDSYEVSPGVIIGFDNFQELPTMLIAIMENAYNSSASLTVIPLNKASKDIEIVLANEHDLSFDKEQVLERFDKEMLRKEEEISDIKKKKEYFLHHFKKYFINKN